MSQPQKDLQIATEPPLTAEQGLSVFRDELRAGRQPEIERYLYRTPHDCHPGLLEKLLTAELQERQRRGEPISVAGYISRLPQFAASIPEIASRALDLAARESWEEPGPHDTTKVFVAENPPAKPWPVAPGPVPDEFPRGPGIIQPLLAAAPPLQISERPQPVAKPSTESLPTRVGKYEVVRQLGKGGFGAVYLCHDPDLDDEVAVKVLRPEKNTDNLLKTLRDEGRKSRQLHNRGARVVPVLDTGTDQFGSPFMVMKFMQGGALSEQLRKRGAHTWQEAVQIIVDLARTLAILHAEDIYHRDIKPLNILLDDRGQPHLADFGLAARIESLESDGSGHSPGYASPEQVLYGPSRIDGRSDLYSLGVVFYELLTGKLPVEYQRRVKGDYERRVSDPGIVIPPVRQRKPEVPEAVAALCERCLKWDRTERPQAAADLVEALGRFQPIQTSGYDRSTHQPSLSDRSRLYGLVVLTVTVIGGLGLIWHVPRPLQTAAPLEVQGQVTVGTPPIDQLLNFKSEVRLTTNQSDHGQDLVIKDPDSPAVTIIAAREMLFCMGSVPNDSNRHVLSGRLLLNNQALLTGTEKIGLFFGLKSRIEARQGSAGELKREFYVIAFEKHLGDGHQLTVILYRCVQYAHQPIQYARVATLKDRIDTGAAFDMAVEWHTDTIKKLSIGGSDLIVSNSKGYAGVTDSSLGLEGEFGLLAKESMFQITLDGAVVDR